MNRLTRVLMPLLLIACTAHGSEADNLFLIRSQGYALISNLIAYYDPYDKYADPNYQGAYQQALLALKASTHNPELLHSISALETLTAALEKKPLTAIQQSYPQWINPLLEQHAELDSLASRLQQSEQPPAQVQQLSILVSEILLLYQVKYAQLFAMHVPFSENTVDDLDQQITTLFAQIRPATPEQSATLEKLSREYEFVRPQLKDAKRRAAASSVKFYLGSVVKGLDAL